MSEDRPRYQYWQGVDPRPGELGHYFSADCGCGWKSDVLRSKDAVDEQCKEHEIICPLKAKVPDSGERSWTDGTPGIEYEPTVPWGAPVIGKPTTAADIRAMMEKMHKYAMTPEIVCNPVNRERALVLALDHALRIIECYETDIRGSNDLGLSLPLEKSLAEYGFCQGYLYMTAREFIRSVARGEKTP